MAIEREREGQGEKEKNCDLLFSGHAFERLRWTELQARVASSQIILVKCALHLIKR